jgi:hypothetical protein
MSKLKIVKHDIIANLKTSTSFIGLWIFNMHIKFLYFVGHTSWYKELPDLHIRRSPTQSNI